MLADENLRRPRTQVFYNYLMLNNIQNTDVATPYL